MVVPNIAYIVNQYGISAASSPQQSIDYNLHKGRHTTSHHNMYNPPYKYTMSMHQLYHNVVSIAT